MKGFLTAIVGVILLSVVLLFAAFQPPRPAAPLAEQELESPNQTSTFTALPSIEDVQLDEISGMAASRRYPNWLWMHNDSGDSPRLFLLDDKSKTRAVVNIENANAIDWEDMSIAGKGRNVWIYIGDIGDNLEMREEIVIYRLREPKIQTKAAKISELRVRAETMTLQFPDGARNCETLLANARGELILVTKSTQSSEFYLAAPFKPDTRQTLKLLGAQQFGSNQPGKRDTRAALTTGGTFSPDEKRIGITTYSQLLCWDNLNDWTQIARQKPQIVALPPMKQCESVAWLSNSVLRVSSEGSPAPLWQLKR